MEKSLYYFNELVSKEKTVVNLKTSDLWIIKSQKMQGKVALY